MKETILRITTAAITISLLSFFVSTGHSAAYPQESRDTNSVTGRVLVDGKPAQGVIVMAAPNVSDPTKLFEQMLKPTASFKATTDSEGRYRIESMPAGRYTIAPSAATLVGNDPNGPEKQVTVSESTTIENIDFTLSRGGVITGTVTDSQGRPVIAEEISLKPLDPNKAQNANPRVEGRMYYTDDRGVYRIYGLAAGRYIVSAGLSRNPMSRIFSRTPNRGQTYFPGVTDEARAKAVEVVAGAEASGVDIKLAATDKGYTVSGRVIAIETGAAVANAMITYAGKPPQSASEANQTAAPLADFPSAITTTNAKGEFRLESVAPGSYRLDIQSMGALTGSSDFYGEPVNFEVQSSNIEKLDIKVHLGASIVGTAVVEGSNGFEAPDPQNMLVLMTVPDNRGTAASPAIGRVAADGGFRIGGLKPGKVRIQSVPYGTQQVTVLRIERNGVEQPDGIDVQANEQITGVRVILAKANASVRGRVMLQGGTLAADSEISVWARPLTGAGADSRRTFPIDAKGNFVIENLGPGEYEVEATAVVQIPGGGSKRVSVKQPVSLTTGSSAEITLILRADQ